MAELLNLGKEESARIRVENIIREDIYIELLEMLELYCELLLARIGLLDKQRECDPGLEEAVKTIIFAAPHTDIKELVTIRDLLSHKFGPEFTQDAMNNEDGIVQEKITKRTSIEAPSPELVSLYLKEIAKAYEVPFSELDNEEEEDYDDEEDGDGGKPILLEDSALEAEEEDEETMNSTPRKLSTSSFPNPSKTETKSPILIRPPTKSSDNPNPKVKIPSELRPQIAKKKRNSDLSTSEKPKDDFDELRKRFEALKR